MLKVRRGRIFQKVFVEVAPSASSRSPYSFALDEASAAALATERLDPLDPGSV